LIARKRARLDHLVKSDPAGIHLGILGSHRS
jgi:hypothetical protein